MVMQELDDLHAASAPVRIGPMRRRHLRGVLRIEELANPRPWSLSLFLSELRYTESRAYLIARVGTEIVGYAGLMLVAGDGHVTNVGVVPDHRRRGIATRLMLELVRRGLEEGAEALALPRLDAYYWRDSAGLPGWGSGAFRGRLWLRGRARGLRARLRSE